MNVTRPSLFLAVFQFVYYTERKPKNKNGGGLGMRVCGVGKVERQPGRTVGPRTPTLQGTAVVCNIQERQLEHNWYLHMYIYVYTNAIKQLCRLAAYKTQKACSLLAIHVLLLHISLVSPSLATCQVNTMELATNCFRSWCWLGSKVLVQLMLCMKGKLYIVSHTSETYSSLSIQIYLHR